ncbi:MAG TPA: GAF domain-containing protein [Anaerolineales bacterium]|nr:GAF domain-containing protein [Anaerolineales bacterium]
MNKRFFHLPETSDPKIRSAFRYISIIMVATLVALLFEVYLAIRIGAWQLWGTASTVLLVFAATNVSRRLILSGKTERAAQFLIYSVIVAAIATPFFISDVGISLSIASTVLIVEFASRTTDRPERYVIASFVAAAITILLDLFLPDYRLVVPELQLFIPLITGVVLVILGIMVFRGFADYSLRTKMIIVIVTVVMISIGTIAFLTNRSLSTNVTESIGSNMSALANSKASEVAQLVDREVDLLHTLALDQSIQNAAQSASLMEPLSEAEIERLDSQWRVADAEDNNLDRLVTSVLVNHTASQLRQFHVDFPQHVEAFLTDHQGLSLAATNRTSDYYQADEEWWQVAYREGLYIGQPEYEASSKTLGVIIAVTIRDDANGNVIGILRTTVNLEPLAHTLASGRFGESGLTELYLPNRQELSAEVGEAGTIFITEEESGFDINDLSRSVNDPYFETIHDGTSVLASQARVALAGATDKDTLAVSNLNWRVIVYQDKTEAMQPVQSQTSYVVFLALIIFIIATFVALGLAQIISGPMVRLNAVAERVAAGDLMAQAPVETGDETGTLARTFNSMTTQLRDLISTLEQRVADRTKALATSAEVSRNLSTILNERQLVIEVVEQLKASFDYYHVHIYLLDKASGDLIMSGGTGDAGAALLGAGHKVAKGKGLVGRAAENNIPILVSDTSQDPTWLPNPLLPETKSEAAVPIATANEVLGVLDVQQNEIGGLKQEDVDLLQSLANQVAVALLNARSYVEIQQRAEREARIISIGTKIKSTASIEEALQTTARELGRTLGANDIRVILEAPRLANSSQKPD